MPYPIVRRPSLPLPPETADLKISARLHLFGFHQEQPPWLKPSAAAVDRALCAEIVCPECSTVGMGYLPFWKCQSYRVVASCETCGFEEEF